MKFTMRTVLMAAAAPIFLAACENADLAHTTAFPKSDNHPYITSTSGDQMVSEASGRKRVRDLRAEVTGNIKFLRSHLGEERSHILDMQDSLLVSLPRAVAVKSVLMSHGIDACRIGVIGKGSDDHVAAPVSDRRNQYNDRVEILMKPFQDGACV